MSLTFTPFRTGNTVIDRNLDQLANVTRTQAGALSSIGGVVQTWEPYTVSSPLVSPTDWINPTLTNGWVNYGGGRPVAAYRKDQIGTVWLSGEIKSGSVGAFAAFTLPVGFRPDVDQRLPCYTGGGTPRDGLLQANTTGDIQLYFVDNQEVALSTSFPCADRSPYVSSAFPFNVGWTSPGLPQLLTAAATDVSSGDSSQFTVDWTYTPSLGQITINNIPGLLPSTNYAITLFAF